MHTDVVGRVEARQWKHYSKGYVSRQGEAWYYLYYIFNRKDALGSIVLQRKADIFMTGNRKETLQFSFCYCAGKKHQSVFSPNNVNVCLTCFDCQNDCWSLSSFRSCVHTVQSQLKRIRSVPGNKVLPVRSSAIIHPTDQISTVTQKSRTRMLKTTLLS